MSKIQLGQLTDMNVEADKEVIKKWLVDNLDDVMSDLNRCQNLELSNAILYGLLTDSKSRLDQATNLLEKIEGNR